MYLSTYMGRLNIQQIFWPFIDITLVINLRTLDFFVFLTSPLSKNFSLHESHQNLGLKYNIMNLKPSLVDTRELQIYIDIKFLPLKREPFSLTGVEGLSKECYRMVSYPWR